MKQYKSKDFRSLPPEHDTLQWISNDRLFLITTTMNLYSQYFVYIYSNANTEWVGITVDSLDEAIEELNKMIKSGEIERFEF